MVQDVHFLSRALELARQGSESGDGGPFGAVVVQAGRIVGEGWNRVVAAHDPTAHAEILALRAASKALQRFHLDDCVLYASSEPCPMCLAAAYWARIARVVYANPRSEAAAIGFSDDWLYRELTLPPAERGLPLEHMTVAGADSVLKNWFRNPDRTDY